MNSFKELPPDQLQLFLHLYARWDQYRGGVETCDLVSHTGIDKQNLKPLLEALSAAGHIKFQYDTVTLKESVHNEIKREQQAYVMSDLQRGALTLILPTPAVLARLDDRIAKGRIIAEADLDTLGPKAVDPNTYPENADKWYNETAAFLESAFREAWPRDGLGAMTEASTVKGFARIGLMRSAKDAVGLAVSWLEAIADRVRTEPNPQHVEGAGAMHTHPVTKAEVFIVHGHDKPARESVANAVLKLGLEPVILVEETGGGRTIIENLVRRGFQVTYAIAILTPDDLGVSKAELSSDDKTGAELVSKLKPRPRQNVVLELGYFVGKLGRERVCVLYKSDHKALVYELSDWHGVVCIQMDENDAWKHKLGKELHVAGIEVDLTKV